MGGDRIVVHTGSCGKISREQALELAKDTMRLALKALDERNLGHVHICPETMGKINQLGTLYEVMELCKLDVRLIPCIDFGHLNARTIGGVSDEQSFGAVIDRIKDGLGYERASRMHVHFSRIEYSAKGEVRHLTFDNNEFGPDPGLIAIMYDKLMYPTVICESAGTQAKDALMLKQIYNERAKLI